MSDDAAREDRYLYLTSRDLRAQRQVVRIDESPPERLAARRNKRAKASKSQDTASKDSVIDLT